MLVEHSWYGCCYRRRQLRPVHGEQLDQTGGRGKRQDLFVDNDIDLDASLGSSFQTLVKTPFLIFERRATKELEISAIGTA